MANKPYVLLDRDGTMIVERTSRIRRRYVAAANCGRSSHAANGRVRLSGRHQSVGNWAGIIRRNDALGSACANARTARRRKRHSGRNLLLSSRRRRRLQLSQTAHRLGRASGVNWISTRRKPMSWETRQSTSNSRRALGAVSILVRTGYGAATEQKGNCRPDYVADDLSTAAEWILQCTAK